MENDNTQPHDKIAAPATDLQNTEATAPNSIGKGKILPQIGMGIVGEIIAAAITFLLLLWLSAYSKCDYDVGSVSYIERVCFGNQLTGFVLFSLISIPCIAEFVRWGGKLSGGHRRRKLCFIGAIIGSIITLACLFIPWFCLRESIIQEPIQMIGVAGLFCFVMIGAIIGYRKEAK